MRELKFRVWHTKKNCDYYELEDFCGVDDRYFLEDTIVEQYTGLKDENGKEIYEGDIIESSWNCERRVVEWNGIEGEWEHYLDFNTHSKYGGSVVIGNIHENKELLNGHRED